MVTFPESFSFAGKLKKARGEIQELDALNDKRPKKIERLRLEVNKCEIERKAFLQEASGQYCKVLYPSRVLVEPFLGWLHVWFNGWLCI